MSAAALPNAAPAKHALPSGRSVVVRTGVGREELEVRSPAGEVEVVIVLTDDGPIVRLAGARLELDAVDTIALRCRNLEVAADETVAVTGQEMNVRTRGDICLDGDYIRLNCAEVTLPAAEGD
jgi:hypothetical protein